MCGACRAVEPVMRQAVTGWTYIVPGRSEFRNVDIVGVLCRSDRGTSPIGGAILERWHGDYTGMKIYSGVMMLSGAALVFVSRMMATEWKINAVF